MRYITRSAKRKTVVLFLLAGSIGATGAMTNQYLDNTRLLADSILAKAEQLRGVTHRGVFDTGQAGSIVADMKQLISQYEENMVLAQSPYPGEIVLGTTPAGDSTWLEIFCDARYSGLLREIRIRRTGRMASYLRINDIEITSVAPRGSAVQTFNKDGRAKLYPGGVFSLALPKPIAVVRIRVNINHESTGLVITGVPYKLPVLTPAPTNQPQIIKPQEQNIAIPEQVLLGTTPPGHSTWLQTLCSNPYRKPVREIRLRRTGREASYLRINDIEITFVTPRGLMTQTFNEAARAKLYFGSEFILPLPQPMLITRIRIKIDHESTGLEVYGIH
ncbi:MAG: hypothetical protein JW720_07870 [Sedimentisphaerales bacterium]|nr:hypothetical protein [Sedimentisphaerales bacterium]